MITGTPRFVRLILSRNGHKSEVCGMNKRTCSLGKAKQSKNHMKNKPRTNQLDQRNQR